MNSSGSGSMIEAVIPTRGLIGFEFELLNMTSGHGIMSHLFKEYAPVAGEIAGRSSGTLVSMETGISMAYSLDALESRGKLLLEQVKTFMKDKLLEKIQGLMIFLSILPKKNT